MLQESKICRKCGLEKPINKFRIRKGATGLFADNKCISCRAKMLTAQLKLQMLEAFGWKCSCCGVDHPQFLTLEHVQGGRHFYGRRYGRDASYQQSSTYMELARAKREGWDRTKWECLCMNCNFAKGHYGQCPHRTGVTAEQVIQSLRDAAVGIGYDHRNSAGIFEKGFDARRPNQRKLAETLKRVEEDSIG
jgi:hypothetical protein